MSAGTLTLTNDTDAVTGSGTAFTTELAAGDFIVVTVGGIPYTLPVKTVNRGLYASKRRKKGKKARILGLLSPVFPLDVS